MQIIDKGWNRILRELPQLKGASVDIGIQSDAGANEDGTGIAEYAAYNEFGTRRIPERSFIRSTSDDNRRKWGKTADTAIGGVLRGMTDLDSALSILGQQAEDDIKNRITSIVEPANAQSTIDAKGSSNPLIDTGTMRQAVRYVVNL